MQCFPFTDDGPDELGLVCVSQDLETTGPFLELGEYRLF